MSTIIRYPKTVESKFFFEQRMQIPDPDEIKEGDVWSTIKELAPKWMERKRAGICIPGYPIFKNDYWKEHSKCSKPTPFIQFDQYLENTFGVGKTAIDIGCGKGHTTQKLLECGWNVIAIDPCFEALELLANNTQSDWDQLTLVCKSITKFTPEHPVDLVVCKDVFPHLNPAKFKAVWEKIHHLFLKKNGFLIGTIFSTPSKLDTSNQLKEIGAWFVPDKRMILPMIEEIGYKVEITERSIHKQLKNEQNFVFQFMAQKI